MARQTVLVDDFDGSVLSEDDGEEVYFTYKGTSYRLDLSQKNVEKMDKALAPFIDKAEKVGATRGRPKGSGGRASTKSGYSKETLAQIRDWAKQNGHEVSDRGRISAPVLQAWEEAHAS